MEKKQKDATETFAKILKASVAGNPKPKEKPSKKKTKKNLNATNLNKYS